MDSICPQRLLQSLNANSDASASVELWFSELLALLQTPQFLPGSKKRRDAIINAPTILAEGNKHHAFLHSLRCWEVLRRLIDELAADPWSEIRSQMATVLAELLQYFSDTSVHQLAQDVLSRLQSPLEDWKLLDGYSKALLPIVRRVGTGVDATLANTILRTVLRLTGHEQLQIRKTVSRLAVQLRSHVDFHQLAATLASEVASDLDAFSEEHCRSIEGALMIFAGVLELDRSQLVTSTLIQHDRVISGLRATLQGALGHPSSTVRQSGSDTWLQMFNALTLQPVTLNKIHVVAPDRAVPPMVGEMLRELVESLRTVRSWQHTEGCLMTVESIVSSFVLYFVSGRGANITASTSLVNFVQNVVKATLRLTASNQFEIRRMLAQLIGPLAWITTLVDPLKVPHLLELQQRGEDAVASNTYAFAMLRESLSLCQWLDEIQQQIPGEQKWGLTRMSNTVDEKNLLYQLKLTARENIGDVCLQAQITDVLECMRTAMVAIMPFVTEFARQSYQASPAMGTDIAATMAVLRSFVWSSHKSCQQSSTARRSRSLGTEDTALVLQVLHDLRTQTTHFVAQAANRKHAEAGQAVLSSSTWSQFCEFSRQNDRRFAVPPNFDELKCLSECWSCVAARHEKLSTVQKHAAQRSTIPVGFRPPIICVGGLAALSMSSQDTIPAMIARDLKLADRMLCEEIATVLPTFALSLEICELPAAYLTLALATSDWLTDITVDPLRGGRRRVRLMQCLCHTISNAASCCAAIDCTGYPFPIGFGWAVVGAQLAGLISAPSFENGALPDLIETIVDVILACRANRTETSTASVSAALAAYVVQCCNNCDHELLNEHLNDCEHDTDSGSAIGVHSSEVASSSPRNADDDDQGAADPWADWDDDIEDDDVDTAAEEGDGVLFNPQMSPLCFHSRHPSSPITSTSKAQSQVAIRHRVSMYKERLVKLGSDLPFVLPAEVGDI